MFKPISDEESVEASFKRGSSAMEFDSTLKNINASELIVKLRGVAQTICLIEN